MWYWQVATPPWVLREIEITEEIPPIELAPDEMGAYVLLRWHGRPLETLWLAKTQYGGFIPAANLRRMIEQATDWRVAVLAVEAELLGERPPAPLPSLTVAVCTRNHPEMLQRCLAALVAMRDAATRQGRAGDESQAVDLLVVDNAPEDDRTKAVVESFPGVRYALEPVPGLDMGRNRALAETDREWLGFVDDDAVVDRFWLDALAEGMRESPSAAAFTGPILPLMLETESQLRFEIAGGFGKGFHWRRFGPERWGDPVHPANAADIGTGACMVLSTKVLRELGGFDEALDTGPPLPGGGDCDMFYRIIRSGRRIVYLPGFFVRHEHRRDLRGLARQYHSWGQSIMAMTDKNYRADPATRNRHRLMTAWWVSAMARRMLRSLSGRDFRYPGTVWAELRGVAAGRFGEYRRSQRRMALRKEAHLR